MLPKKLERFNDNVLTKFLLYDSIFSSLPYSKIKNTSNLLPLFSEHCKECFNKNLNPEVIVETFFDKFYPNSTFKEKVDLMFRFIQFIERRVVLFDAVEESAFNYVNNMSGVGTLRNLKEQCESKQIKSDLKKVLNEIKIKPVLTAHPTQFYPGSVLGIITDLCEAIKNNELNKIRLLLEQLGRTPFFKKKKPTPLDEARSLIWYLSNVFYYSIGDIQSYIQRQIFQEESLTNNIISLGFWPGGDRDGNPYVTTQITLKTAQLLRNSIIRNYYRDIRKLRRRLTFRGIEEKIIDIESKLYESILSNSKTPPKITLNSLKTSLNSILKTVQNDYGGLFSDDIKKLILKVNLFGYHFASLDIRQDSRVHHDVFSKILKFVLKNNLSKSDFNYYNETEDKKIDFLTGLEGDIMPEEFEDDNVVKTLNSIRAIKQIQENNGEIGCNRYIISNNQTAINIFEVYAMIKLSGFELPKIDIVPLFETIPDLEIAESVMEKVYSNSFYRKHLKTRGNKQIIMLGFSDGTKDGGYLTANWSIYKAKEKLTKISRKYNIDISFFDGRGGPPARGGGNTNQFYSSLGKQIQADEIQLTVQGQTISSNFGTLQSCRYNLEQLLSASVNNKLFDSNSHFIDDEDRETFNVISKISHQAYNDFKSHPKFLPYLENMSTLKFYAKTNIGSRPSKRKSSESFDFASLRAIPFVGSWSQLKQNVPGFYGVGYALEKLNIDGKFEKAERLYNNNLFFRTLISNSMMSLEKSFFKLTDYMKNDEEYGGFWNLIYNEYLRTKKYVLKLTKLNNLMDDQPAGKASIKIREEIVLPLLTIQQYALIKLQKNSKDGNKQKEIFEKIVTRSLFGNINASRNSA